MSNVFNNTYKNKKVLVTGHTGFKGSWLTLWLLQLGAEVIGYALEPDTTPSMFNILGLEKNIEHIIGDIRDGNRLGEVFKQHKPEIIFHLAAQPLVSRSYDEPKYTFETNVMGTINLLEAVRVSDSARVVVNITSDKCYENKGRDYAYKEYDPMGGFDPYSASKGAVELVTSSYRNSFFNLNDFGKLHNVSLASARAGNVIGGGDWAKNRLIPDFINAVTNNKELVIRKPDAIRPWQFVLEPLSGYLWLGSLMMDDNITYAEGWNFGPEMNNMITVKEVIEILRQNLGYGEYNVLTEEAFHEAGMLKLDISKAKNKLNWYPVYDINASIGETANWYKIHSSNKQDMLEISINQIDKYINKARELNVDWSK